jgi:hypothetical protein
LRILPQEPYMSQGRASPQKLCCTSVALSKLGRVLKEQPFIGAFAYGFNETGVNAKPISKVGYF